MSDYRIVFYDEIEDPHQISQMFQLSLFFPAMPSVLQHLRTYDDRYTPEFGIFAVTKDGTVAAGHLLMQISTATVNGKLEVGGVNAVGTRPDHARRGLMTTILNRTHEYFKERGLEYSILTTSRRLGAMMLYDRLDYVEVFKDTYALKYPNHPRTPVPNGVTVRAFRPEDVPGVDSVYFEAVKGSYGFIYRPHNFLRARDYSVDEIKPEEKLRIAEKDGKMTGYAYWTTKTLTAEAPEIMALDSESLQALLADAEQRNPGAAVHVICDGLAASEVEWLQKAGYQGPVEAYGRLVVKDLKGKSDAGKIKTLYGVESGKFRIGLMDGT